MTFLCGSRSKSANDNKNSKGRGLIHRKGERTRKTRTTHTTHHTHTHVREKNTLADATERPDAGVEDHHVNATNQVLALLNHVPAP